MLVSEKSIFAFLDVLGFSDRILAAYDDSSTAGDALLNEFEQAAKESFGWLKDVDGRYLRTFTDNVILSHPISVEGEHELFGAICDIACFQLAMANRGFFVRGCVSLGQSFVNNEVIFGDALILAARGEKEARFPRVVVHEALQKKLNEFYDYWKKKDMSPHHHYLLKSHDGKIFINYLYPIIGLGEYPLVEELEKHATHVRKVLSTPQLGNDVHEKFEWVVNYHNRFCSDYTNHYDVYGEPIYFDLTKHAIELSGRFSVLSLANQSISKYNNSVF